MGLRDNVSNRPTFLGFIFILGKMTVYLGLTSNVWFIAFYFVFLFKLIDAVERGARNERFHSILFLKET